MMRSREVLVRLSDGVAFALLREFNQLLEIVLNAESLLSKEVFGVLWTLGNCQVGFRIVIVFTLLTESLGVIHAEKGFTGKLEIFIKDK